MQATQTTERSRMYENHVRLVADITARVRAVDVRRLIDEAPPSIGLGIDDFLCWLASQVDYPRTIAVISDLRAELASGEYEK